ncbi:hypothetical protein Calag_0726 [Caldisphaera lagunensis DSM 15908]|uniref:Archaeal/vacuolar-type H+-ATPase subunit C n=1 Tax=Caldisphaera lagunensis (strain DSM 15908 / JCM 11604 / ANMR 0165 / IC-154) TaxID=1056495 RepID=L0A9C2_CALLD|nr:V-type ATPase subunit [Caldisphaera lagunensis]AFZ70471.1 hypothetical protein Calag_0726 [Caldisphaera lagunensis DSM 15908]
MGSPSTYAKIVPRLRYLKSTLIPSDKLRELSPPISDIYAFLRESKYRSVSDTKSPEDAEKEIMKRFYSAIDEIAALTPSEAMDLTLSFAKEDEINDSLLVLRSIIENKEVNKSTLISLLWSQSSLNKILAEPDSLAGVQRYLEISSKFKHIYNSLKDAYTFYNELKDASVITWYSLAATSNLYSESISKLNSIDKDAVSKTLCPIIEGKIALGLIQSSLLKIPIRVVEASFMKIKACNISWNKIGNIYERESGDPMALATSLRDQFKYLKIEGRKENEIMDSIRKSSYISAKRKAEATFQSYPFSPSLISAALILLKLEVNNLKTIVISSYLKLSKEEYENLLII